jgi:tRNA uracil 4-sulfurtransferase
MMNPTVIIHYGEIALKGKNRGSFEKRLEENIRTAFRDSGLSVRVKRVDGRFLLRYSPRESAGIPDARRYVVHRLKSIPGITYFGFGYQVDRSIDEIIEASLELYKDVPAGSFKVDSRRADKSFKYTSPEINRLVGEAVVKRFDAPVDLNRPQNTIRIEIAYTGVYVFCNRHNGVGGLPVGSGGRVVSMLSAGYDSPVASYLLMKRGARVLFTHFHSYPYVPRTSIDQVTKLVERLADYQGTSVCYMIPLAEIQKKIMTAAPSHQRVLLYRRAMMRLAGRIATRHQCEAIVTGESLGQVASQTIRNIGIVGDSAALPVLRPLIGLDKDEIIALARKIGTEKISAQPYDDCCSFLLPRRVETWGEPDEIREIEAKIDLHGEYATALNEAERLTITRSATHTVEAV